MSGQVRVVAARISSSMILRAIILLLFMLKYTIKTPITSTISEKDYNRVDCDSTSKNGGKSGVTKHCYSEIMNLF